MLVWGFSILNLGLFVYVTVKKAGLIERIDRVRRVNFIFQLLRRKAQVVEK